MRGRVSCPALGASGWSVRGARVLRGTGSSQVLRAGYGCPLGQLAGLVLPRRPGGDQRPAPRGEEARQLLQQRTASRHTADVVQHLRSGLPLSQASSCLKRARKWQLRPIIIALSCGGANHAGAYTKHALSIAAEVCLKCA